MTITQTQKVLKTLTAGKTLTAAQAKTHGIGRLSARVWELRNAGFEIDSIPYTNSKGQTVAKYVLATTVAKTASRSAR